MSLLLGIPTVRLLHPSPDTKAVAADGESVTVTVEEAGGGPPPVQILDQAEPLLARLAPHHKAVAVSASMSGGLDGAAQRQWCLQCTLPRRGRGEGLPRTEAVAADFEQYVELRYDGDTGKLLHYSSNEGAGSIATPGTKTLTAPEAVEAARKMLVTLDLASPGSPATVLCSPRRFDAHLWQVWLQGRDIRDTRDAHDAGDGPLTVKLTVNAVTGTIPYAAVAERASYPPLYLPHLRRPSGSRSPAGF